MKRHLRSLVLTKASLIWASLILPLLILAPVISAAELAADGQNTAHSDSSISSVASAAASPSEGMSGERPSEFPIPGPLRSFLRMAGMSQEVAPEQVLSLLSRNVFLQGYEGSRKTEFLVLLSRYVVQAKELTELAGSAGVIRISNCEEAKPLLLILGYRTRRDCGTSDTSLQTADSERAFLTIDSGFPLPALEQTLQGGKPFAYPYAATPVPVLFAAGDWTMASKSNHEEASKDLIGTIMSDAGVARLYWDLSRMDSDTNQFLRRAIGIRDLLPHAAVLDFYGSELCIRGQRVIVPGGAAAESAWKDLAGASPASPEAFVRKLLAADKGWLIAYFDALSRVSLSRQVYFTAPQRLRLFYSAFRGSHVSASATTGSFRPAPALLRLVTRLLWEPNGEPFVPGNLEVWNEIFRQDKILHKSGRRNIQLATPDQLIQTLFALSRANTDEGSLQIYLALSEVETRRSTEHRLSPETVRLLARKFESFRDQYRIFSEFQELSDASIVQFLEIAEELNSLTGSTRGNALGIFQANVGIWQILARQGQIVSSQIDDSWQQMVKPFAGVHSAAQLYEQGRTSLGEIFRFGGSSTKISQHDVIESLAGPGQNTAQATKVRHDIALRIHSVLEGQRLLSLDTLFALGDALSEKARGKKPRDYAFYLAGQIRDFQMPQPIFTSRERTQWAAGIYDNHHTQEEMSTDLAKVLQDPSPSAAEVEEARGRLAPFLRDTLVGLNYAYYEPPGAQALHNNPLLVRSHDFAAESIIGAKHVWRAPRLVGQGSPAGGGAHFVGSIADLPYVLADLEQDFIAPENIQALIWRELAPGLLSGSVLPRWWNVTHNELHAVALYQRSGEEMLSSSATDPKLREAVTIILSDRADPQRVQQVNQGLMSGQISETIAGMTPADTFYLAVEFQRRYPEGIGPWGPATEEIRLLCRQHPDQVNWKRLSQDFGVPHPTLAQTYGRELLNIRLLPPFAGYPSRFLAESWDSPNLYWARLADESGLSAVTLNYLAPQLTERMVEKISATDFEDWPSLLRAMRETGQDFQNGKIALLASDGALRQ